MTEQEFLTPQTISDEDFIYRQVHRNHLTTNGKNTRFPKAKHFVPDPDGLSVNCCRLISLTGVYHLIGLSYKHNKPEFKNPEDFTVFRLPVPFIRSIEGVIEVRHTPILNGDPAPIGSPNNFAHTSLMYSDDPEIRMKLSDYCHENHEQCFCPADFVSIELEVAALREKMDKTPYHRLSYQETDSQGN